MILLLLAACAWVPAKALGDAEHADVFLLESHGHTLAGTALVATTDGETSLHALAPTGMDLFEVHVDATGATVSSPDPDLLGWLERMPFQRDLTALYRMRCEAERCRFEDFRVARRGVAWRIRGPGGPATFEQQLDRWRLVDPVRGYSLTVIPTGVR